MTILADPEQVPLQCSPSRTPIMDASLEESSGLVRESWIVSQPRPFSNWLCSLCDLVYYDDRLCKYVLVYECLVPMVCSIFCAPLHFINRSVLERGSNFPVGTRRVNGANCRRFSAGRLPIYKTTAPTSRLKIHRATHEYKYAGAAAGRLVRADA